MSPSVATGVKARTAAAKKAAAVKAKGVDGRTDHMTEETLACRSRMHIWVEVPLTLSTLEKMVEAGAVTITSRCANNCGAVWTEIFDPRTWERVETRRLYEKADYSVPKGSGRLPKRNARKALMTRKFPSLFAA